MIGDEPGRAPVAHPAGERRERREGVVRDEGRRSAAGKRVLGEVGARAHRDEQVALLDTARVGLQPRDLLGPRSAFEPAERELGDLVESQRDHGVAR